MIGAREAAEETKIEFSKRLKSGKRVWGAPYGLPTLDEKTGGVHSKQISFLVADSGVGKSSLGGQFAIHIARWLKEHAPGRDVRVVTLEMHSSYWIQRVAAADAGIPLHRVNNGFADLQEKGVAPEFLEEQERRFDAACDEIASLPIQYIGTDSVSQMQDIKAQIQQPAEDGSKCSWWLLDHLNLIPGSSDPKSLSENVHFLTRIARTIAPGMVLTQIPSKQIAQRSDKRPTASDIFNTSAAQQDADLILGLYREDRYVRWPDDRKNDPRPAELTILKARYGEDGWTIPLWLLKDRLAWVERERTNG